MQGIWEKTDIKIYPLMSKLYYEKNENVFQFSIFHLL